MPRIYHRNEWFYELAPTALSESEFESLLIQNADIIRPNMIVVPFKKTVYGPDASAKADLAMISNDYRQWVVVEVEMERHDLYGHVLPQIRALREGTYDQDHAAYLAAKNSNFDAAKLRDMLRGNPPEVLVLVNKPDGEWQREISRYGAHTMVFEIYRSPTNRHIFVVDGELPRLAHDMLTELSFGMLPRCLAVGSPAALDFEPGKPVEIFIEGQITYWERFHTATDVYLSPAGVMPIKPGQKYALARMSNGRLTIRPLKSPGEQ
jgi:hypothetical protein